MRLTNFFFLASYFLQAAPTTVIRGPKTPSSSETILSFGRICALESGTKQPYIHVFYPDRSVCVEIKCFSGLSNLTTAEELTFNLISRSFRKKRFSTAQSSKNRKRSSRNPLIDEYCMGIPQLWKLRCPHELKQVAHYFKNRVEKLQIAPTPEIPLLISLDYGTESTQELNKNPSCPFFGVKDDTITAQEASFLKKYFKILSEKDAYLIFSLYHKMMVQVENMKTSGHYWADNKGFLTKLGNFFTTSLKKMGLTEVIYRLLLIESIFFLNQQTGFNIGKDLRNWALKGAHRGCPTSHESSNSSSSSSSNSSRAGRLSGFGGGGGDMDRLSIGKASSSDSSTNISPLARQTRGIPFSFSAPLQTPSKLELELDFYKKRTAELESKNHPKHRTKGSRTESLDLCRPSSRQPQRHRRNSRLTPQVLQPSKTHPNPEPLLDPKLLKSQRPLSKAAQQKELDGLTQLEGIPKKHSSLDRPKGRMTSPNSSDKSPSKPRSRRSPAPPFSPIDSSLQDEIDNLSSP